MQNPVLKMARNKAFKKEYYILWDMFLAMQSPYNTSKTQIEIALRRLKRLWKKD